MEGMKSPSGESRARGRMEGAGRRGRRLRPAGGWSPQRFPRVGTGSGRRSRPARPAHLGVRGRRALERGGERGRGPAALGARVRGGGGVCPRTRGRGHGHGGGPGAARAGALLPSRLPADRGTAGTQRPDLSPGRVPGRRADAPRSRLLLGAYRALGPSCCRRRRRLPAARHPFPTPRRLPGPGAAAAPGLRPPSRVTSGWPSPRPGCGSRRSRKNAWPAARPAEGGGGATRPRFSGCGAARARPWRRGNAVPTARSRSPAGGEGRREEAAGAGLRRRRPQSAL